MEASDQDHDLDDQLQQIHSENSQSSSSSVTPTKRSPDENERAKNRNKRKRERHQGDAVLLNFMNSNHPDIVHAATEHPFGGLGDSDSDSDESGFMDDHETEPEHFSKVKSELSNGQYVPMILSKTVGQSTEVKEDYKFTNPYQKYRYRTSSITSSQDSVKSETPSIKRERANTGLSVDSSSLPYIQGSPEQKLKPLTNSGPPSRQISGDLQLPMKLPSIHEMMSHVVPRMAEVNIPRCSTPVSLHDERSPSSSTLSRRNTFSTQSPQDIQSHQNRRPPPSARNLPPRLPSTSSGSTTTTTSNRSGSTCTSRTESITPRSLTTPSDRTTSASSPPEQSSPETSFYPIPLGGYTCHFPGCTAAPFQTQYLLNSHKNVHSSERPHYCPVVGCKRAEGGKGFKRKNEMIRHGLVHSSPGYVCPYCPDRSHTYPRPDNLQRHVSLHHKEKDKRDPSLRDVLAQRPPGMGSSSSRRRRA